MRNVGKVVAAAILMALCLAVATPAHAEQYNEMNRLYNPNSGEHFYTASLEEGQNAVAAGWVYEGVAWYAPKLTDAPVYRLYNQNAGDHHYTLSSFERDYLVSVGWNDEGVGWYSAKAQGGIPVYREYNPNAVAGAHNFTTSMEEHNMLVSVGWHGEGIAWYGTNKDIEPTGIRLNTTSVRIATFDKVRLEATVLPPEVLDNTVKWESEDEKVATVEDGVVTAYSVGKTRIIASTSNGKKAYCEVEVFKGE